MDYIGIDIKNDEWEAVHVKSSITDLTIQSSFHLHGSSSEKIGLLKSFIKYGNLKKVKICIAVPGVLKVFDFPAATDANIEKALKFELEKHLPLDAAAASCCFQITRDGNDAATVLSSIAVKDTLDELKKEFADSGFEHISIFPRQASVCNGFSHISKIKDKDVVLAFISEGELEIEAVSRHGPLYSKTIRIDWAANDEFAERLRREITVARAAFGRKAKNERDVEEICMCADDCQARLSQVLTDSHSIDLGADFGFPISALAAFGAVIGATGKGRLSACLHGTAAKTAKEKYLGRPALSAAIAALSLLILASYPIKDWMKLRKIDSALSNIERDRKSLQKVTAKLNDIDRRITTLERVREGGGGGPLDLMKELTELTPDSAWLTYLDYNGIEVHAEGFSDSASALLLKLERSKLMEDFEFAGPVVKDGGNERFKIKSKRRKTVKG